MRVFIEMGIKKIMTNSRGLRKFLALSAAGILLLISGLLLAGCDVNVVPGPGPHACRRVVYRTVCRGGHRYRHCYTVKRVRWVC